MKTITWTPGDHEPEIIRGRTYTGGRTAIKQGARVVVFLEPILPGNRQLCAKTEGRPDLAELANAYDEEMAEAQREADERARAQREADATAIAAMLAEEARLASQIPADAIRVAITKTGDLDGDPILSYRANGIELAWDNVVMLGTASAFRPGAMGAFDCRRVGYITPAALADIVAGRAAKAAEVETAKKAEETRRADAFRVARESGRPQLLDQWAEERRACEGGEWGDYVFRCCRWAMPDGSTKKTAENQY